MSDENMNGLTPEQNDYVQEFEKNLSTPGDQKPPTNLLAGKYKSVEDLENAYKNLEKKLGAPKPETPPANTPPNPEQKLEIGTKPETPAPVESTGPSLDDYLQKAGENGGNLGDDEIADIKKRFNLDDKTLNTMRRVAHTEYQNSVKEIVNAAGGQDKLNALSEWVAATYNPQQIADINNSLKNPNLRVLTIEALMNKMATSVNNQPHIPQPTNLSSAVSSGYKTDAELREAMSDVRYTDRNHPEHEKFVSEVTERYSRSPHLH